MNGNAKRLMAIFAVLAMIAAAMVVVLADEQDSSADTPVNCKTYYYDQLTTDLARNTYEGLSMMTDFTDTITVTYSAADIEAKASNPNYVKEETAKGSDALSWDDPTKTYYFRGFSMEIYADHVDVIPYNFDPVTFSGDRSGFDANITTWISNANIDTGKSKYDQIKDVHNYVASTLSYDTETVEKEDAGTATAAETGMTRSLYKALNAAGNHKVVCEGYAKMFKAICNKYNIDCITVVGDADNGEGIGPHMWNYVRYDSKWFVVDCTWDDNDGGDPYTNYLLAGTNKSIGGTKVGDSHYATGTSLNYVFYDAFEYPTLSALSVRTDGTIESGTQYLVTFKVNETVFSKSYAVEGDLVPYPGTPTLPELYHFLGWKESGSTELYDFTKPVNKDLVIVADITMDPIFTLIYDSQGGSKIQNAVVKQEGDRTVTITASEPVKEGFKFLGWNTSKDGKGVEFKAGDKIIVNADGTTLYAVWEDTSTVSSKINSFTDNIAKFLSQESIPGVSNLLLTIGIITSVVSLLAIIAIARK